VTQRTQREHSYGFERNTRNKSKFK